MKYVLTMMLCVSMITSLIAGCSTQKTPDEVKLTVNYPNSNLFYKRYGYAFENKYPNIKLKIINQNMNDANHTAYPDVIFMDDLTTYQQFVEIGAIQSIESELNEGDILQSISPITIKLLSTNEYSNLYGLAPGYTSHGLFYNKQLFQHYGIPEPTNQMSWSEIFELAKRFPNQDEQGNRLYGFKTNYYEYIPFATFLRMGQTHGLTFMDFNTLKVKINTPSWNELFQIAFSAFDSGMIYDVHEAIDENETMNNPFSEPSLLNNNVAMQIASQTTAYNFETYSQFEEGQTIDWGVVTVPVDPANPEYSDSYQIHEIFGISSQTEHSKEAWKLVEFITNDSDNLRSIYHDLINIGLPSRDELLLKIAGHDLSPLYQLQPVNEGLNPYDYVHYEVINAFKDVGQSVWDKVVKGEIPMESALEEIESRGQQVIQMAADQLRSTNIE
jgi:multiple sugar transport system substrate-binding protein